MRACLFTVVARHRDRGALASLAAAAAIFSSTWASGSGSSAPSASACGGAWAPRSRQGICGGRLGAARLPAIAKVRERMIERGVGDRVTDRARLRAVWPAEVREGIGEAAGVLRRRVLGADRDEDRRAPRRMRRVAAKVRTAATGEHGV